MIHNNKRINTLSINLSNLSKMLACPAAVEPRLSRGKTKRSPLAGSSGHRYLSSWKAYVCCWIGCTIDFDDDDTLCQLFFNSAWQFSGLRTVLNPWTMDVTTINCRGDSCFSAVGERESSEVTIWTNGSEGGESGAKKETTYIPSGGPWAQRDDRSAFCLVLGERNHMLSDGVRSTHQPHYSIGRLEWSGNVCTEPQKQCATPPRYRSYRANLIVWIYY